ncbi:MAG: N-acetylmuramoyl-L-alanine amidase, partial [Muribaculaceae bacterium]|nr:N-acetylmuramoyl-L-alanine amidase [Muribaculaceae bacterium]
MKKKTLIAIFITISAFLMLPVSIKAKDTNLKEFTVVIDAGHGGKDIGAADNGAMEKQINLGVALRLEEIIKKKLKNVKVVMTRSTDTYLTLQQRADVANKAKGDLFISIHTNSVDKSNKNRKTVTGSSVYALGLHKDDNNMKVAQRENSVIELESNFEQKYKGFDPSKDESYIIFEMAQKKNLTKSLKFAEEVQKELVGIGRANRGVHQAGFWVLWATSMPAVLIELDFICNPTSAAYMTSSKGEEEFASAIFKAVEGYYKNWEKTQTGNPGAKVAAVSGNIKEEG